MSAGSSPLLMLYRPSIAAENTHASQANARQSAFSGLPGQNLCASRLTVCCQGLSSSTDFFREQAGDLDVQADSRLWQPNACKSGFCGVPRL